MEDDHVQTLATESSVTQEAEPSVIEPEQTDSIVTERAAFVTSSLPKYGFASAFFLNMFTFPITEVKSAREQSSNFCEYFVKAVWIIYSKVGWLVFGFPIISIILLTMGCIYISDCKIQPNIPVYLIAAGSFGLLADFIAVCSRRDPGWIVINCIIHVFLIIWLLLGCYWVYAVFNLVEYGDTESNKYCNKTIYRFTLWVVNITIMLVLIMVIVVVSVITLHR